MRIVYLNPCGQLGGAETCLRELLTSLRATVPDWELCLVLGEDGPLAEQARDLGVAVKLAPFPPALASLGDDPKGRLRSLASLFLATPAIIRYARSLARILGSLRPDVVHTNGFKMHILGACTRPHGARLVWHIHDYVGRRGLTKILLSWFHRACTVAIANSNSVAQDLRKLLPGLKVTPVYNAINLEKFSPAGSKLDLDAMAELPPAAPEIVRVGLVATFARWKGHRIFLQAIAQLPADVPIRGYIIGGPIYQTRGSQWSLEELKEEAARLGLRDRIGFTGFIRDTPAAMRSLDVVVHASTDPEPFGMVIIEGMACQAAIIASDAGGASELIRDGDNALAHPPGDSAALAAQILRLVVEPGLRQELGRSGRASVERSFEGKRFARQIAAIYGEVCGAPAESKANTEVAMPQA